MGHKQLVVWAIAAVVVIGVGVLLFSPAGGGAQDVSPERSAELVAEGVRVIDVRTPGEYEMSHIERAENVPMNMLAQESMEWDRDEPVLVYCTTGARSSDAIRYLADQGFTDVYHLAAGIIAYQGAIVSGADEVEIAEMPEDVVAGDGPVLYVFSTDW